MPSKSSKQRVAACMALAVKEGKLSKDKLVKGGAASSMASMSIEELRKYCKMEPTGGK